MCTFTDQDVLGVGLGQLPVQAHQHHLPGHPLEDQGVSGGAPHEAATHDADLHG